MSATRTKILLVEDSLSDAAMTIRHLRATDSFEPTHLQTLSAAKKVLLEYDLVLLDLSLPDSDGLNGLRELRALSAFVPIVILSGLDDEVTAQEAINQGAHDYLSKDLITEGSLNRSIKFALLRTEAESERKTLLKKLCVCKSLAKITGEKLNLALKRSNVVLIDLLNLTANQEPELHRSTGAKIEVLREVIESNDSILRLIDQMINKNETETETESDQH